MSAAYAALEIANAKAAPVIVLIWPPNTSGGTRDAASARNAFAASKKVSLAVPPTDRIYRDV
jgi:hypothetical protein